MTVMRNMIAIGLLTLLLGGCAKEQPAINLDDAKKPDRAEQIANGQTPSGADMAKDAAAGK